MTIPYLIIEILIDALTLIVGIACMVHAADNWPRRCWGFVTAVMGATFVLENVGWLRIVCDTPQFRFESVLDLQEMLEFYAVATVVSFFPMASLRPGYLNLKRTLPFLIPPIVVITMGLSYLAFNGQVTPLDNLSDVGANLHQLDVQLRLTVFAFSLVTPLACFYSPFIVKALRSRRVSSSALNDGDAMTNERRPNAVMWAFLVAIFGLVMLYAVFTLCINYFIFNLFGAACVVVVLVFAVLYLRRDNPFTMPPQAEAVKAVAKPVFREVEIYMEQSQCYIEADCSLAQLSASVGHDASSVSQAIKEAGFTGFREYVTYCRLNHFCRMAHEQSRMSVKELMYASGFTSRSAFYRAFANYYQTTPSEFLQSLREQCADAAAQQDAESPREADAT